jgi:hypothetical protein
VAVNPIVAVLADRHQIPELMPPTIAKGLAMVCV